MKISGTATLNAGVDKVWQAILDPNVLARTIPGCESLQETGEHQYAMVVTAGVASIKGTYQGKVKLSDLVERESLLLHAEGASPAGTIAVDVKVSFTDRGDGTTQIDYDADAIVGGMIGGVGQRMLTSVSKRMSNEFFSNIDKALTGELSLVDAAPVEGAPADVEAGAGAAVAAGAPRTFGTPAPAAAAGNSQDLLKGLVAGAAIALIGVAVGAVAARRR